MSYINYPGSLHGHTDYSNLRLRDCNIKIADALKYATQLGHSVIAFTDHETVSSWLVIERAMAQYPNLKVLLNKDIIIYNTSSSS